MGTGRKPTNVQNLIIRPVWGKESFPDSSRQRHRGVMVAVDQEGNELARGTTYAEFMANLRSREEATVGS